MRRGLAVIAAVSVLITIVVAWQVQQLATLAGAFAIDNEVHAQLITATDADD